MALLGHAVLAFWHDIADGGDADFNHWHTEEHIPERVGIPGFLRGRRYEVDGAGPRYFNLYETAGLDVLGGPAYVERLQHPTPWTQRTLPLFRNSKRTACRTVLTLGRGVGGALATLDLAPAPGRADALRAWLTGTALPALSRRPAVIGAHLCEADVATTQVKSATAEGSLQDRTDVMASWVVLVEGIDTETVAAACRAELDPASTAARGAAPHGAPALYRLAFCLEA
jgi:hypothetical protein